MCTRQTFFLRIWFAGMIAATLGSAAPAVAQAAEDIEAQLERDLTVAQKPIFLLNQLQTGKRLGVDAWVDNPRLTYAVGEPLRVMVRPHQHSFITVVDVGSSGRVLILYPNRFQTGERVRAGSTIAIPQRDAHWEIRVSGPAGVDLIQVIASRHPLTLPELNHLVRTTEAQPLITLGRSADDVARDLVPQLKPPSRGQGVGVRNVLVRIVASAEGLAPVMFVLPAASTRGLVGSTSPSEEAQKPQ